MNFRVQKKSSSLFYLVVVLTSSTVFGATQPEKKMQKDYFLPAISTASSQSGAVQAKANAVTTPVPTRKKKPQRVSTRALFYARNTVKSIGGYAAWEVLLPKKFRNRRVVGTLKVIDIASFLTAPLVALLAYRAALGALSVVRALLKDVTYNSGKEKENPFQKPTQPHHPSGTGQKPTETLTNLNPQIPLSLVVSN